MGFVYSNGDTAASSQKDSWDHLGLLSLHWDCASMADLYQDPLPPHFYPAHVPLEVDYLC